MVKLLDLKMKNLYVYQAERASCGKVTYICHGYSSWLVCLHTLSLHSIFRFSVIPVPQKMRDKLQPESSKINSFWMPNQVRHDEQRTFYEFVRYLMDS